MKKAFLIAALFAASTSVFAQQKDTESKLAFSVGVEGALPIGDMADVYTFGIGGSVQADYAVAPNFAITLNAGYSSYSVESVLGGGNVNFIPVLAGGKYHFSDKVYGSAQLGVTFTSASGGSSSSTFTYAPGVGFNITPQIDALVKVLGWNGNGSNSNAIGLRVAYTFGK